MPDFNRERYCVEQFASLLGLAIPVEPRDPFLDYGHETGLDVIADIHGLRIGFQVTELDAGEGVAAIGAGRLRPRDKARMRESEEGGTIPSGFWGSSNFKPAFTARVTSKSNKSAKYSFADYCDEAWLLMSANVPGSPESTFAPRFHIYADLLDEWTGVLLANSRYARVYFHVIMGDVLFAWDRGTGWRKLIDRCQKRKKSSVYQGT